MHFCILLINRSILLCILLCLAACSAVSAQSFSFRAHEKSEKHTATQIQAHHLPDTIIVRGDAWYDVKSGTSWKANMKIKSVQDYARFYIDHAYPKRVKYAYDLSVCFSVTGYTDSTTSTTYAADTLRIIYNPDSLAVYQDAVMRKYSNFHKLRIIITNIFSNIVGPVDIDTMTSLNFNVEGAIITQRYDKKYSSTTYYGSSGSPLYGLVYPNAAANYAELFFNISGPGIYVPVPIEPANFELEWTYVDDYHRDIETGTVSTKSSSSLSYDFRHNATRVWLDTNYFRIPLIYQSGYLVYRMRMVRPDSNNYRYPIYGPWSLPDSGEIDAGSPGFTNIADAHKGDSLNWQYTVSFAENGRYKHVLSYFDGLLKNRQSLTRFNSTPGRLIATEQVYDYEGRPAISILPTPVSSTAFTYQHGLSTNSATGQPYKAADFDTMYFGTCPNEAPPSPLHADALANVYYSSSNPDQSGFQKFVPDAGGYPFVQTIYSAGYDKRIDRQGGAGDTLQIGFGHDTRNEYVGADQKDLNRLFGIDAGWSGYYRKTVTTDPNGQVSISVQDYKGRQVSSALIGRGPNPEKLAIVSNDNVPDSSFRIDELIQSSKQSVVGNTKTLNKDFYTDIDGYDSIQYVFDLLPMRVCSPSDSAYLSVKAHYKYEVYDECGNQELSVEDTVGITGVMKTADTVSSTGPMYGIYLKKGTHTLTKELTVHAEEIDAAVDSLMKDPPDCFHDKPWFIKESVLKEEFPCPAELSECEIKRRQMKEELWPGKKYGKYTSISYDAVDGGDNSLFTRYCHNDTTFTVVPPGYIFQAGSNPDTITVGDTLRFYAVQEICQYRYQMCRDLGFVLEPFMGGGRYREMRTIPVKDFIALFCDATADSLLPLHPEYCKYKNCFDDTYPEVIKSIPSAAAAEANDRFAMDSIIAYDPILPRLSAGPLYFAHARDSLALYRGGRHGIDTLALLQSYCNSTDSLMTNVCLSSDFKTQISTISFLDPKVKEIYFPRMRNAYFANRERFKAYLATSGDSTCEPCIDYRMRLIPQSIFSDIFNADGSYNPESEFTKGTVLYGPDDDTSGKVTVKKLLEFDDGSLTLDSLLKMRDSAALVMDTPMMMINKAKIDSIIATFANCTPGANLPALADTLYAIITRQKVQYGDFTPAQIRYAMDVNGISITDLCNPYMVSYEYHEQMSAPPNTGCRHSSFYEDMLSFLNKEPIQALVAATASGSSGPVSMNISTIKPFESQLYNNLFSTSIRIIAERSPDTNMYTLSVMRDITTPPDTVRLSFKMAKDNGTCQNILAHSGTPTLDTFSFSDVRCITDGFKVSLGTGYIVNLSFIATVQKWTGAAAPSACDLLSWNNRIQTTGSAGSLQDCVPCTQMLSLYRTFTDSMTAYGVKGIDHPLYPRMLVNYMNEKLYKIFSWENYTRFMESCALADSLPITRYNGYAAVAFANDGAANTFLNYINTTDTVFLNTLFRYQDDSVRLLLDFSSIPLRKMRTVRDHISSYLATAKVNSVFNPPASSGFIGWIMVYDGTPFDSSALRAYLTGTFDINPGESFDVWTGSGYAPYTRYDVRKHTGATNAMISAGVAYVNKFIEDEEMAAYFMNYREHTADAEYTTTEKQDYLQYVYQFSAKRPSFVLDTIRAQYLDANVYTSRSPQYGSSSGIPDIQHLFLSEAANPGLAKAQFMLDKGKDHFTTYISPSAGEFTAGKIAISGVTLPERLDLFFCSDKTYWYRYFNAKDTLFNLFFRLPEYIPNAFRNDYEYIDAWATAGAGTSRSIQIRLHKGSDTLIVDGFTDFTVGNNQVLHDVLLANGYGEPSPTPDTIDNCERTKLNSAIRSGIDNYKLYLDSIRNALRAEYTAYVMSHIGEKLYLGYWDQRHGITLYYYDRAGNLNRTIPPGGVRPITNTDTLLAVDKRRSAELITPGVLPLHKKMSVYEYNSLDKVIRQSTPDGGEVGYVYDQLGRVIYSQNAKQAAKSAFTYTFYDAQGRVTETGEVDLLCGTWAYRGGPGYTIDSTWIPCIYMWYPASGKGPLATPAFYSFRDPYVHNALYYTQQERERYIRAHRRSDVVYTTYDTVAKDLSALEGINAQENLRKRVTCIRYFEQLPATDTFYKNYTYATHYSYDIAGNVKTLVHDYPFLTSQKQRYKTVDYDYDLASGKVNMLSYNKGWGDQYYQRYGYDDDNRVTRVETSADGVIWKRDAEYQYYQHGPLARASIGDLRVQGIDFAYTIQGWLKAVNGDLLYPAYEMGLDSFGNNVHAYDAAATAINYFKGDYKPIGGQEVTHTAEPTRSLYNGNISRLSSDLLPFKPLMANFTYDQLNRIKYAVYDSMSPIVSGVSSLNAIPAYKSMYDYDPDGNITRLIRRANKPGAAMIMDSMRYKYAAIGSNNRLYNITDSANDNYIDDVDKFTDPTRARYLYDQIGNVVKDEVGNQDTIQWNMYNKVTATHNKANKSNLRFVYDGAGHRVAKFHSHYGDDGITDERNEFFVHDAQGNILAVYKHDKDYRYEGATYILNYGTVEASGTVRGILGTSVYLAEAVARDFMLDGHFEKALAPYILAYETAAGPKPAMHYLSKEPGLTEIMLSTRTEWVDSLRDYSFNVGNPMLIPGSMASAYVAEDQDMGRYILYTFLSTPDTLMRRTAMSSIGSAINPDSALSMMRSIHGRLELNYDTLGTVSDLAANLVAQEPDPDKLASAMAAEMIARRADHDYLGYFDVLTAPTVGLAWSHPYFADRMDNMTGATLSRYGERGALMAFFGDWSPTYGRLQNLMGPDRLYSVDYHYDPLTYLEGMVSAIGPDFIDTAVAAVGGGLSIDDYAGRIEASLSAGSWSSVEADLATAKLAIWKSQILTHEEFNLAEHHLYGSARLGIKNYYTGQVRGYYMQRESYGTTAVFTRDTGSLVKRSPWYSGRLNELISENEKVDYAHTDLDRHSMWHILGQKQYEVTNHLGNVLSTISDNRYERGIWTTGGNGPVMGDSVKVYAPAVPTSYDYYPFGMLMPGRYLAADTITEKIKVMMEGKAISAPVASYSVSPGPASTITPPTGTGHASLTLLSGDRLELELDTIGAGMILPISTDAGVETDVQLNAELLLGDAMRASIVESFRDENQVMQTRELVSEIMTMEGTYVLSFVPSGSEVSLKVMYHASGEEGTTSASAMGGGAGAGPGGPKGKGYGKVILGTDVAKKPVTDLVEYRTVINRKDLYRFGFDGMEKVNEIYGRGTHYDFGARYYDARVGRWFSTDPLYNKYPFASPYVFALNTPIRAIDKEGKDVEVAITRNPQSGGGSILFSQTVYISGPNAIELVEKANKAFDEWKTNSGTYKDKNGSEWHVKVQMTFKVATPDDVKRIRANNAEQENANLLESDYSTERSFAGYGNQSYFRNVSGKFSTSGNSGTINPNSSGKRIIHESMHNLGLGDRYTDVSYKMIVNGKEIGRTPGMSKAHVGFENDIMSEGGMEISQVHINNLAKSALETSEEKGTDNFISGRAVDHSRSSKKTENLVPSEFTSGNTQYTEPIFAPAGQMPPPSPTQTK